jgi:hypothetical protein
MKQMSVELKEPTLEEAQKSFDTYKAEFRAFSERLNKGEASEEEKYAWSFRMLLFVSSAHWHPSNALQYAVQETIFGYPTDKALGELAMFYNGVLEKARPAPGNVCDCKNCEAGKTHVN